MRRFRACWSIQAPSGLLVHALDHGFQTSLWVLTGVLVAGAALVSLLLSPPRPQPAVEPGEELVVLDEAA